jgi:hypothetical protein
VKALYFLGTRCLGESSVGPRWWNYAYFCETCGDIWARIIVSEPKGWNLSRSPCENHTSTTSDWWRDPPGSLIHNQFPPEDPTHPLALRNLPREALFREFILALNYYESTHAIR